MSDPERPERVEHRVERTYDVVASPEQVWEVIATADGLSSWMAPARLDPRVGGAVSFDLGDFTSDGVVTGYAPGERFAIEEPWPIADRPEDVLPGMARWFASIGVSLAEVCEGLALVTPVSTEFIIEAASGGTCVVRVVTSAYGSGADWENEFFDQMVESLGPFYDRLVARFPVTAP